MPSLDNIYDLCDVLKHQKLEYILLTSHTYKKRGKKITNIQKFHNIKTKTGKEALLETAKNFEIEINNKNDKNKIS